MTPEAQRIAIAEVCGYELLPSNNPKQLTWQRGGVTVESLPDYLSDLNAMCVAAQVLNEKQREIFACILGQVIDEPDEEIYVPEVGRYIGWVEMPALSSFKYVNATAAQRAEAFLRTLNLWKTYS